MSKINVSEVQQVILEKLQSEDRAEDALSWARCYNALLEAEATEIQVAPLRKSETAEVGV